MGITTAQLVALRRIAKRKAQPRRKLHGGFKVKNPNPQPYLKTEVVKPAPALVIGDKEADQIRDIMQRYEVGWKQAKQIWLNRRKS